ncbi:MAG: protelomerase family protein [Xenococcaceae cyanobacterium MO_207.B15]|nr:protelomerase family protein [Xenococcaceae cyanobacterium MO_207.B15]
MNPELMAEAIAFGRTKWLRNLIADRLEEIIDEQDIPSIQQWDSSIKEFMSNRGLIEPRQQKDYWTDIRNAIAMFDPHHPALEVVGLTTEQWITINQVAQEKLQHRTTKLINDPDAVVNTAQGLLLSDQWSEIAAGLATVTGRRCSELLQTASFSYCSPYSVLFTGATKRRNEENDHEFEIPTLVKAELVLNAIARLRSLLPTDGLNLKQINQKYSEPVAKACHRHFQHLIPTRDGKDNLYTHIFRAVYATIAAHWFCPPTVPVLEYRAAIQGHFFLVNETDPIKRHSIATQRHYFDYQIGDGIGNIDGRLGIKLNLPLVKIISSFDQCTRKKTFDTVVKSIPESIVHRFHTVCDHLKIPDHSFVQRLDSLLDYLETKDTQDNCSNEIEHKTEDTNQHLSASVHLLATTLANLTQRYHASAPEPEPNYTGSITSNQSTSPRYSQENKNTRTKSQPPKPPKPKINTNAIAHINYVIDSIINYNNNPHISHKQKWRIGPSILKKLTTADQKWIYQVYQQRFEQISQHHQLHQLPTNHNKKGRGANTVTEDIQVIPYHLFKQQRERQPQ